MRIVQLMRARGADMGALVFSTEIPDDAMPATHDEQADALELALRELLPGGVYDRLLARMASRKLSATSSLVSMARSYESLARSRASTGRDMV